MPDVAMNSAAVLTALTHAYDGLSPQLQIAARFVLDHPREVAVSSMRQVAQDAGVKPNTLVRLARELGFKGYDDLRHHFQEDVTRTGASFPSKARWLHSLAAGGRHSTLLAEMAGASMANVEEVFSSVLAADLKAVAGLILRAPRAAVLGVGTAQPLAHNFCYVASMIVPNLVAVPAGPGVPIDDVVHLGPDDVLLTMTFAPYRAEVVAATRLAAERGVTVIAITDSLVAPIALLAEHTFVVPTRTPQYFSSMIGTLALLETLLAFMAADTTTDASAAIEAFHQRREAAGIYQ